MNRLKKFKTQLQGNWLWLLAVTSLIYLITAPARWTNQATHIILVPFIGYSILGFMKQGRLFQLFKSSYKKEQLAAFVITAIFWILLPFTNLLESRMFQLILFDTWGLESPLVTFMKAFYSLVGWGIVIPACTMILFFTFLISLHAFTGSVDIIEPDNKHCYQICLMGILVFSFLFLIAGYPGILHSDGTGIWEEIIGVRDWSDWHPVGYLALVYATSRIWQSPFAFLIVQTGVWVYTNHYILKILKKYRGNQAVIRYTIFSSIAFLSYVYLHIFYKDVIFGIALLGFMATLLGFMLGERRKGDLVRMFLFGLLASITRHMSLPPVLFTLMVLAIFYLVKRNRRLVITLSAISILILITSLGSHAVIMKVSAADENPSYVTYSMPLHMMGAYAASGEVLDQETLELMNKFMPAGKWSEAYNRDPYCTDYLSRDWYGYMSKEKLLMIDEQNLGGEIIKANLRFISSHPIKYCKALFKTNSLIWQISTPSDYGEWISQDSLFNNGDDNVKKRLPELMPQKNIATSIIEPVAVMMLKIPAWRMIACRGGFAVFCIVWMGILLWRKQALEWMIPCLPAIAQGTLLLLSIPAHDPRYVMPIIQAATLLVAFVFGRKNSFILPDN